MAWPRPCPPSRLGALLATAALLVGCGPMTLWSSAFPRRYSVATRVTLTEAGREQVEVKTTACSLVDQRDSLAGNVLTRVEGERHTFATADGGLLVFADLRPCRWSVVEEPPEPGRWFPIRASSVPEPLPEGAETLADGEVWWFDDPDDPHRMEAWHSDAVLGGSAPFAARAEVSVTEGEVTRTLTAQFPWLAVAESSREVARARDAQDPDVHPWTPRERPDRFEGVVAEAWRIEHGGACASAPPDAAGPVPIDPFDPCTQLPLCRPGRDRPCRSPLGGLVGEPRADAAELSFRLATARTGWIGAWTRHDQLPADAPLHRLRWAPTVCVEGWCHTPPPPEGPADLLRYPTVFLPDAAVVVTLAADPRDPAFWTLILQGAT